MKTFLENLKNELKRRNFSEQDIEEIVKDHVEMIEEAKNEGLNEDEIQAKFGNPATLAQDLMDSRSTDVPASNPSMEGYTLLEAFPVLDPTFDVKVSLVNDDVDYLIHDKESIEVYYKDIKKVDNYHCRFDGKDFVLEEKKKLGLMVGVRLNSGRFIIKVPSNLVSKQSVFKFVSGDLLVDKVVTDDLDLKTTSGDVKVKAIEAKHLKLSTVSGDVSIYNGSLDSVNLSLISGDAKFDQITVSGDIYINTVSGDVAVNHVESGYVDFKTVSGDCSGLEFYPKSIKLKSISGDINIHNKDKERKIEVLGKRAISGQVRIEG
jgi:hypothetical protein